MATAPSVQSPLPVNLPMVEVDVALQLGQAPVPVRVPAHSAEEAFAMLITMGEGMGGTGAQNFYYGSVLGPIRDSYKARLEIVEREILQRRMSLGSAPDPLELRGLAQWAARQRARTARVARLPTPSLLAGLEARDFHEYGLGGRTFDNLMRRKTRLKGLTGTAAYESILSSASVSNPKVNASIARAARHLRTGGAVLGVVGLAVTAVDIYDAPADGRGAVATRAGVSFAGGLIGSEVAVGLVTVGAGLLLGATPVGWVILGVGLVGGVVGGIIADQVFYPKRSEPVARQLNAGIAIDPKHLSSSVVTGSANGMASTLLPIIRQVPVMIRANDTQFTISHRAAKLAAASVGLPIASQMEFADRYANRTGLNWVSGDPTPEEGSSSVNSHDVALTAGHKITYQLNETQRAELTQLAGW